MRTPQESYLMDAAYHALVDTLHAQLVHARFSPSEVREAAMLACIHYESQRVDSNRFTVIRGPLP